MIRNIIEYAIEPKVDGFDVELSGFYLGKIKNVVNNAQKVLAGILDFVHVVSLLGIKVCFER